MNKTPAYDRCLEEAAKHHASSKTYSGLFLRPHAPFIKQIIEEYGVKSILDYGAGKGEQYKWIMPRHGTTLEQYWGIEVAKYDPCWPPFAKEPQGKFDLVMCAHTLGSVPITDLGWVVDRLYSLSNKAIYVAEKIGKPKKAIFSDPTKMPIGWTPAHWMTALARETSLKIFLSVHVREEEQQIRHSVLEKPGSWCEHRWPPGVRAMDASWA